VPTANCVPANLVFGFLRGRHVPPSRLLLRRGSGGRPRPRVRSV